jgi:small conductance mechanosensitive channel
VLSAFLIRLATATLSPGPSVSGTATPTPSPTATSAVEKLTTQVTSVLNTDTLCRKSDVSVCGVTYKLTGSQTLGKVLEVILGVPLRLLVIIAFAVLLRRVLHQLIDRLSDRIAEGPAAGGHPGGGTGSDAPAARPVSSMLTTRRQARARTLAQVLGSVTTVFVAVVATLMAMQELSLDTAPLLASASVIGVALGLGAQSLVRDVVSGMFMIAEDQCGVGDVVDVGEATGSVEAVGLRITRLRDVNGTVWYVRNGEIMRVGNQSQGWARTVLDVNVGLGEDLDEVERILLETAERLRQHEQFGAYILDDPEVWGVESLTTEGVLMRVVVKTQPLQQWTVARELRKRIKDTFDEQGIEMKSSPLPVVADDSKPAHQEEGPLGK